MDERRDDGPRSPLLSATGLSKRFPGVRALDQVDLDLLPGEILAVIGENGAGKSTLMKILAGVQKADAGQIAIEGLPVQLDSTRQAMRHGIALIHQELNLCDNLNIGQNIFLGREPMRFGWIDRHQINRRARDLLKRVGLDVSPTTLVAHLTIGRQQMVEIAKALSVQARILIMDEPSSSLSAGETETLFQLIESLRDQGVSIIYISHRLSEVRRLADRVVVLRDGRRVGELTRDQITHDRMVQLMVGRDVSRYYSRSRHPLGDPVFRVERLRTAAWPDREVSFEIRAGEIVGLAGLVGAGRTELLETLFGIRPRLAGTIRLGQDDVPVESPREAIDQGVCLVPEDRKRHGVILDFSVLHNIALPNLAQDRWPVGLCRFERQRQQARTMCQSLDIRASSMHQVVKTLSGGNQQKTVIGKWLTRRPRILLMDEPTRGIDIGAKQQIYRLMERLAAQSMAILFASSDLEEVLGLADRALVMHQGDITGELGWEEMNEQAIMQLATRRRTNET